MAATNSSPYWTSLLMTGNFSDFAITCHDRVFKVHRTIICQESDYFRTLCESTFKERQEGVVDLKEDHPDVLARVLSYLYTEEYQDNAPPIFPGFMNHHGQSAQSGVNIADESLMIKMPEDSNDPTRSIRLTLNMRVYVCADKLGIASLKRVTSNIIREYLKEPEMLRSSYFAEVLRIVYENTAASASQLRFHATLVCVRQAEVCPEALQVLREYEPMVWQMTTRCIRPSSQGLEIKFQSDTVSDAESENIYVEKKELEEANNNISSLINLFTRIQRCGSCGKILMVTRSLIIHERDDDSISVRCLRCSHMQPLSDF